MINLLAGENSSTSTGIFTKEGVFRNERISKSWPQERLLGWAGGNYTFKCHICNDYFMGDKRASMCYPCAVKREKEMIDDNKGSGI
jgi:hypothetical protein